MWVPKTAFDLKKNAERLDTDCPSLFHALSECGFVNHHYKVETKLALAVLPVTLAKLGCIVV